ncbi:MAG: PilZ domain-containing protein [Acidobacteria bacterium]|nr:PilZ domain-containing protein [Acidobacteriota bacterium]
MLLPKPPQHHKRFYLNLPIRVWFRGQRESQQTEAIIVEDTVTTSISSGGCFFFLRQKPMVGTEVKMEITVTLPGVEKKSKIRCRGKIIRIEKEPNGERIGVASTIEHYQIWGKSESHAA